MTIKEYGKNSEKYAAAFNLYAFSPILAERYEKTEKIYKQALKIIEKAALGKNPPIYGNVLINIVRLYIKQKYYTKAKLFAIKGVKVTKNLGENHISTKLY